MREPERTDDPWAPYDRELRDPAAIIAYSDELARVDPQRLTHTAQGDWWDILRRGQITVLVTREYEHLFLALSATPEPTLSDMRLPHPRFGVAVDHQRRVVHVACTRNPNQIYDLVPVRSLMPRLDASDSPRLANQPLVPVRTRLLPGCLYLHDLAVIGGELYATAVGQNAIVRITPTAGHERVWWPKCVETPAGPIFGQNHLQLNSIAAADRLEASFFSASSDAISRTRPGDPDFPVDGRGVIFSGASREPIARGLTRPHSARLHGGDLWVANSGYGEVGIIDGGRFRPVVRLPGWTRGLCFHDGILFVGTSRVLPRFRQYAPGVDLETSQCGVHAIDPTSGRTLGSVVWPGGNQIFAVDQVSTTFTRGLPFIEGAPAAESGTHALFYAFESDE